MRALHWLTCCVLVSVPASAFDGSIRVEPGVAFSLSEPQRSYFGVGFQGVLGATFELIPVLDVTGHASYLWLSPASGSPAGKPGTAAGGGVGVRLHRPIAGNQVIPWFAAELGFIWSATGTFSLLPSAGLLLKPSGTSPIAFGPFVRFSQAFKLGEVVGRETYNGSFLAAGLTLEFLPRDAPASEQLTDTTTPPTPPPDTSDTDGDGIPDSADSCMTAAEDKDGFEDADGCPDPDDDGDGVEDRDDKCPLVKGSKRAGGCPDSDNDGVSDDKDGCPLKPGKPDNGGCPLYAQVVVTESKIEIKQKLYFAYALTSLLPKSFAVLTEVAEALEDHSTLCVRVEGHTDSKGVPAANKKLSKGRADSVRDYLVSKGTSPKRLAAVGYGDTLPRDSNATADGRDNNRRVEFVIVPCTETENAP